LQFALRILLNILGKRGLRSLLRNRTTARMQ